MINSNGWEQYFVYRLMENGKDFMEIQQNQKKPKEYEITEGETKSTFKYEKSAGSKVILAELITHATRRVYKFTIYIFNRCLINNNEPPDDWEVDHLTFLYKKRQKQSTQLRGTVY